MLVTELGMVTLVRDEHSLKADSPMEMTELGMVMLVSEVHAQTVYTKASSPMLVTEYVLPLYVTVSGIIKSPTKEE